MTDDHKILLVLAVGAVEGVEVPSSNGVIASNVERLHATAGITDLSGVTSFTALGQAMRTAAQRPAYPTGTPRFIVAPQDHLFGMARM